ncbi:hypothetical protein AJ79_03454 [Helicocarpus griseus UAMH5409]|uniref:Early meiotic induction protein 1 n=1 Tax=Helicocarpus griseus UAMH5409 TaxID=1447875 RepID=A0A2B7XXT4_9EURO|nr:hypothetical protein AJ79_03454 [Helicocarpus griseus UAMH5409]
MGLWWSSAPNQGEPLAQSIPPRVTPPSQCPPNQPEQSTPTLPAHLKPISRDELAEAELQSFLSGLGDGNNNSNSSQSSSSSSPSPAQLPTVTPTTPESSTSSPNTAAANTDIAPESLYPTTMSCRSAFDYAFFCQSFGGQWVNVYRYGELRSCSEHWSDFWFCMRTRSYPEEAKAKMIADHYRKKAVKYKTGASSEDVWDVRKEPVRDAFQGDLTALEREMKMKAAAEGDGGKEGI